MKILFSICIFISSIQFQFAQAPKNYNSSEIYEAIQKLNFLGSVLYVAAHPDDENTHLISYFANSVHARTAYVSLTRGDGGQNLIGPELREYLGLIRTHELLEARKIDGGIQFFTRANDFGYSKNPDETFEVWDKEQVLKDLVFIYRKFQPDVIINRFDHRTPGSTHGHHTASAILSLEAFDLSHKKSSFPEQLKSVNTWQPKRLFFNPSWFFYGSQSAFEKADKSHYFSFDIGAFYQGLGKSNGEIAAHSRSQHSSQGFGATPSRGETIEYLEPIKGGMPEKEVFEGIDTSWNRLKGGKPIGELLLKLQNDFDFKNPSASIPDLMKAYKMIQNLEDSHWKRIKLQELKTIIETCSGLFLEVVTTEPTAIAGENIQLNFEAVNRSEAPIQLQSIEIGKTKIPINKDLNFNQDQKWVDGFQIPLNQKNTNPYWLDKKGSLGLYQVKDANLIGLPETPKPFWVKFNLLVNGEFLTIEKAIVYKETTPDKGEVYQDFSVVPKVSLDILEKVLVFGNENPKKILVKVKAFTDNLEGDLSLKSPEGWNVRPKSQKLKFTNKNEVQTVEFEIQPPNFQSEEILKAEFVVGNQKFTQELIEINYSHIPNQKVIIPSESKIVRIDLKKKGEKLAYIVGAGDSLPMNLEQIGYQVQILQPTEITTENLRNFDAVVLGVRAFNVLPELAFKNKVLFDYVKNGGTLLVQYNTNRDLVTQDVAPLKLELSRERVTDENSEVRFLLANHPALNQPNKITEKDFENWVQERGLYFPENWDSSFKSLISMNDKNENPLNGSLLVAQYGKGFYVYTGLSFFRELPAGVPGAYRLLANLLSLGK